MINQTYKLINHSEAVLITYILDDEEYARRGTKKPAVIVCPGGGYTAVSRNEGESVALAFASQGFHAFVLRYSVKIDHPFPQALLELAAAVKLVRSHAEEWNIISDKITICGFSAGGHLAASLGAYYDKNIVCDAMHCSPENVRPDSLIIGYPALSLKPVREGDEIPPYLLEKIEKGAMMDFRGPNIRQILTGKIDYQEEDLYKVDLLNHITEKFPPVFIFGTFSDPIIPVSDLTSLANLCKENDVPCELHLFGNGTHGQGLYQPHNAEPEALAGHHMDTWFSQAMLWLGEQDTP